MREGHVRVFKVVGWAAGLSLAIFLLSPGAWVVFGDIRSETHLQPPTVSGIGPKSFKVSWAPYGQFDKTTNYQVRIDHELFGGSTLGTSMQVTGAFPGTTYKIYVITYHKGLMIGVSSPTDVLTGPARVATPTVTDITTSTFVLHWLPVPTATAYHVIDDSGKILATVSATETSVLLTGFNPGQTVTVRVVAQNPSSLGEPSNPLTVILLPKPPELTINVSQIASTSFLVSWNLVEGASSYTVFLGTDSYATVGSSVASLRVQGQEPGASVTVKVRAENPSGVSEYSGEKVVRLLPATPGPLSVTDIGSTTFVLHWPQLSGVTSYQVFNDKSWHLANINAPAEFATIKGGFNPGEIATITLVARNETGDSDHSPPIWVIFPTSTASGSATTTPPVAITALLWSCIPGSDVPPLWLKDADGRRFPLTELARSGPVVFVAGPGAGTPAQPFSLGLIRSIARDPDFGNLRFAVGVSGRGREPLSRKSFPMGTSGLFFLDSPLPEELAVGEGAEPAGILISGKGKVLRSFRVFSAAQLKKDLAEGLGEIFHPITPEGERLLLERSRFEDIHRLNR